MYYEAALHQQTQTPWLQLARGRGNRVLLFTLCLVVLNWFDLRMTLLAYHAGVLYEANPIADFVLTNYGSVGLSVFKTILVAVAVFSFLVGRNLPLAEAGCVGTSLVYVGVASAWLAYPIPFL